MIIIAVTVLLSVFCVWNTPLLFLKELIFIRSGAKDDTTRTRFSAKISLFTLYSFVSIAIVTYLLQLIVSCWALTSGLGVRIFSLGICIALVVRVLLVLLNIGFRVSLSKGGVILYFSAFIEEGVTVREHIGRLLEGITTVYLFYIFIVLLQTR